MSRVKPNIASIESLDEANVTLKELAILEIKIDRIDNKYSKKIGQVKEQAVKEGEEARGRIKELGDALSIYAQYNKLKLFNKKKTQEMSWGNIGFRKSTKLKTKKTTLELLKKLFENKGIRIKEEVDREELKEWEDEILAQVDAAKTVEDSFFYEINKDQVNKELIEQAR